MDRSKIYSVRNWLAEQGKECTPDQVEALLRLLSIIKAMPKGHFPDVPGHEKICDLIRYAKSMLEENKEKYGEPEAE